LNLYAVWFHDFTAEMCSTIRLKKLLFGSLNQI
jgi:hypothetical protein